MIDGSSGEIWLSFHGLSELFPEVVEILRDVKVHALSAEVA
jgi:hypothetical protein